MNHSFESAFNRLTSQVSHKNFIDRSTALLAYGQAHDKIVKELKPWHMFANRFE